MAPRSKLASVPFSQSSAEWTKNGDDIYRLDGNVGIGTDNPNNRLDINGIIEIGGGSRGMQISSSYPDNFYLKTFTNTPNPNLWIGYGDGSGGIDNTKEYLSMNAGRIMLLNGSVGIGTENPAYTLHVNGSFYYSGSSKKYKEKITDLEIDSRKIYDLKPVSYDYKDEYKHFGNELGKGRQFGLIAEEVYDIIPELTILVDGEVSNVDYTKLSVVLLQALKEQHIEINELQQQIEELKSKIK
jgi:hypothetical protein